MVCSAVLAVPTSALTAMTDLRIDPGIPQDVINALDSAIRSRTSGILIPGLLFGFRVGDSMGILAYGLADREEKRQMSVDDVFYVGSVTKALTAAAVFRLMEEEELSLEDSVAELVSGAPDSWSGVTLEHLLTHTSGIPAYILTDEGQALRWTTGPVSLDTILGIVSELPLDFPAGDRWNYTNTNFFLLGHAIEASSGLAYGDFMAARVFGPLGMTHSGYDETGRPAGLVTAYYLPDEPGATFEVYPPANVSLVHGAGGVHSTVDDLLGFFPTLYGGELLAPASVALMMAPFYTAASLPVSDKYGYGCMVWEDDDDDLPFRVGHLGQLHGNLTLVQYMPEEDVSLVLYSNSYDAMAVLEPLRSMPSGRRIPALHAELAQIVLEFARSLNGSP